VRQPDHESAIAGAAYTRHRRIHRSSSHPRPRVLQLLATGGNGGAQESYTGLLLGLDRSRYEVRALSLSAGSAVQRLRALGVPVEVLDETDDEIAVRELGADTLHGPAEFAGGAREPLDDVARNLERWVHALVIRTYAQAKVVSMAAAAPCLHVINALSDEQHPCQALADMLTLRERWGTVRGLRVAFVADGNNVATSLAYPTALMGVSLHVASPRGYELPEQAVHAANEIRQEGELRLYTDPREAVKGVDAVYTDVWASMGQEREAERRRQLFADYQVNAATMAAAGTGALFMHCLPAHRGEEVTDEVIDGPHSVVFDEAENRLHAQKAVLAWCLGA